MLHGLTIQRSPAARLILATLLQLHLCHCIEALKTLVSSGVSVGPCSSSAVPHPSSSYPTKAIQSMPYPGLSARGRITTFPGLPRSVLRTAAVNSQGRHASPAYTLPSSTSMSTSRHRRGNMRVMQSRSLQHTAQPATAREQLHHHVLNTRLCALTCTMRCHTLFCHWTPMDTALSLPRAPFSLSQ